MPPEQRDPQSERANARLGLLLFFIYGLIYVGYVGLNAFVPDVMDQVAFAGLNVAVLYGFGLILGAVVLALLYGWLCQVPKGGAQ